MNDCGTAMRKAKRSIGTMLAIALGLSAWANCAKGERLTHAQMACCRAMDHECQTAGANRACCQSHRGDEQQIATVAKKPIAPPARIVGLPASATAPLAPCSTFLSVWSRARLRAPSPPKYLLDSVLLI